MKLKLNSARCDIHRIKSFSLSSLNVVKYSHELSKISSKYLKVWTQIIIAHELIYPKYLVEIIEHTSLKQVVEKIRRKLKVCSTIKKISWDHLWATLQFICNWLTNY